MDESYSDMDRRLSAIHQQWNTNTMNTVMKLVNRHETELLILAGILVIICINLAYDDYRIRGLYDKAANNQPHEDHKRGYDRRW